MNACDELTALLRQRGLGIGVPEAVRLRHLWASAAALPPDRMRNVLAAAVCRSVEDRAAFDAAFALWVEVHEAEARPATPVARAPRSPPAAAAPRRRWPMAVAAIGVLLAALVWLTWPRDPPSAPEPTPIVTPNPEAEAVERPTEPAQTFSVPVVTVGPRPRPFDWDAVWLWASAIASLLAAGWLWRRGGQAPDLGPRAPLPPADEPPPGPMPPVHVEPAYLSGAELEAIAWGVQRRPTEAASPRIDLRGTVTASARAGLPTVRYEPATAYDTVWLWLDTAALSAYPEVRRVADAIAHSLEMHGLPCERATFYGVPDALSRPDRSCVRPRELEAFRERARVVVLTDGRVLDERLADSICHRPAAVALRALEPWPDLVFVDFAAGRTDLPAHLARAGLATCTPDDLPAWLGTLRAAPTADRRADVALWAGACALWPEAVDEGVAEALRVHLASRTSARPQPRDASALRALTRGLTGRVALSETAGAELSSWMAHAERGEHSVLAQAIESWRAALPAPEAKDESRAAQRLRAQRTLVDLWSPALDEVAAAAADLWCVGEAERAYLAPRLARRLPWDRAPAGEAWRRLPWRWAELTRVAPLLAEGGFLPWCDHHVPPDVSLENYQYYVRRMKEASLDPEGFLAEVG